MRGALLTLILFLAATQEAHGDPLRQMIGGGNVLAPAPDPSTRQLYEALHGVGARLSRMDSYAWRDLNRTPTPRNLDAAMLESYRQGITPIILLEYQGSYQQLDPPQPIGSYADWFAAGRAFAKRFRPGGDWELEQGISGWGVTIFTAINEPDVQGLIPPRQYRDALAGLADGVHSVDRALRVVPGGFARCNSDSDPTLRGYGRAIAGLLDDGHLDGIDLHTYYHARWFPIEKGRTFSAQGCFDRVKAALRLHRDIHFYSTEFNVAREGAWAHPDVAARLFLTAFWDEVGVVGSDGTSPATVLAFPWNLADTEDSAGPGYAMAVARAPWAPESRARVLQMILRLAGDMSFVALDPQDGKFVLAGPRGQMWVWSDLPGWTRHPGAAWQVTLPGWAHTVELWGWHGLRRKITVRPGKFIVGELKPGETYMLVVPRTQK